MKRILFAVMFFALAAYVAFSVSSVKDRSWAVDAPGGKIGYVETRKWHFPADKTPPTMVRYRALLFGPERIQFSESAVRVAGVAFGLLGIFCWCGWRSKPPTVNY